MAYRIVAKTAKGRLRSTHSKVRSLSKDDVKSAFGARDLELNVGSDTSPVALVQLRTQVMERLQSSGGRPALAGAAKKMKVPLTADDLRRLETIAQRVGSEKFKPSTAQVASMILHQALHRRSSSEIESENAVNKTDLVSVVAGKSGLTKADAARAVDGVFDAIAGALQKDGDVRIVGFGTFSVSKRRKLRGSAAGEFSSRSTPKRAKSDTSSSR